MSDEKAKDPCPPENQAATAAGENPAPVDTPADVSGDTPGDAAGAPAADETPDPFAVLEALQSENEELKDRLLRTIAETENLRRRMDREKEEARKFAASAFARDMLSVGDNMARAVQSVSDEAREGADESVQTLITGVEMTERELLSVFEKHGISRIEPTGEKFDPNFHQAMFEMENVDVPSGTVLEVVQAGYVIGERVIRPAMVAVSKGGPKGAPKAGPKAAPAADAAEPDAAKESPADARQAAHSHEETAQAKTQPDAGGTVDRSA